MLISSGGELADLSSETFEEMNKFLPAAWSHSNPVDVLGDAGADRYAKAVQVAAQDPGSDGMLVILTPQAMTEPVKTAEALKPFAKFQASRCWHAGWAARQSNPAKTFSMRQASRPTNIRTPPRARSITCTGTPTICGRCTRRRQWLSTTLGKATPLGPKPKHNQNAVRKSGRTILTEFESKQLLNAYGIPTVDTRIATTKIKR
jgi:acetyltransferase